MSDLPIAFGDDGLIPVVVQDDRTNDVLMLAFMNAEALERTRSTGRMHYWSRSRQSLWKKGETSGNEQIVRSIHVNCYANSLLVRVEQIGVCCHTGFSTCYYRELTPDGNLLAHGEAQFDPDEVYGRGESLHADLRTWLGAYRFLADNDLSAVSGTSRLLRESSPSYLATRIADELREIAGVITGDHRHSTVEEDLILESTQVLYWAALTGIRSSFTDSELLSLLEEGLLTGTSTPSALLPDRARALANDWTGGLVETATLLTRTGGIVSTAAVAAGSSAHRLILNDLDELRTRPYLAAYFKGRAAQNVT